MILEETPLMNLEPLFSQILTQLQAEADAAGEIDWRVSVDSTIARVHQHGATAKRLVSEPPSYTGGTVELQGSP